MNLSFYDSMVIMCVFIGITVSLALYGGYRWGQIVGYTNGYTDGCRDRRMAERIRRIMR